jgi:phage gp46-like protein
MDLIYINEELGASYGECDITFTGGSDLSTAVLISLLSWRRARSEDEVYSDQKYGWWADGTEEREKIGSRLWTLQRRKLLPNILPEVDGYIKEALNSMMEDKVCEQILVNSTLADIDKIKSTVLIVRGNKTEKLGFDNFGGQYNNATIRQLFGVHPPD